MFKLVYKINYLKLKSIILLAAFFIIALISCYQHKDRILYINSYHKGYKPSDAITKGIIDNLPGKEFDLEVLYIDSKRQTSDEYLFEKIDSIRRFISYYKPQVLIVSDDYAVKYLVKPFYDKSDMPIVFCGVNWSAEQYNLSMSHITGMLEVLPLREVLVFINMYYPGAKKLTVLSENSLSEKNNIRLLDTLYINAGFKTSYLLAEDFDNWKRMFLKANEESDIIYLTTNGAIKGWNDLEAQKFIEANIKKPLFTCDDFMMPYCVFGFTKVPIEQGIYAAETAKKILKGLSPSHIPLERNKQTETWFNPKLAQIIGFAPDSLWISNSRHVIDK